MDGADRFTFLAGGCGTRPEPEPAPAAEAAPAPQPVVATLKPRPAWKLGDAWHIALELYSRDWMKQKGKAATPKELPAAVARYDTGLLFREGQLQQGL